MRISKQMWSILKVLAQSDKPLKLTQIIISAKGLKPVRKPFETWDGKLVEIPPYRQLELVSALAGESVSWFMGCNFLTGRHLEPYHNEAAKLFVSCHRSVDTLIDYGLVDAEANWLGRHYRSRQYAYYLTNKGKEFVEARGPMVPGRVNL